MKSRKVIEKVYDEGGRCLGDQYVDLSVLQVDTKRAIIHFIYLDNLGRVTTNLVGKYAE